VLEAITFVISPIWGGGGSVRGLGRRAVRSDPDDEPSEVGLTAAEVVPSFERIYREQQSRLFSVVRSVIGDSDEVEDVLQLVFIEIHRCLPRFEGRSRLSTWLYRIAVNVALQHLRKRRRKRWLVLGPTGEEEARLVSPRNDALRAEERELLSEVETSLKALSEKKRVVWQLHELQGLEPQEIADVLEIPMNTVRSRLLSARKDLMDDLERRGILKAGERV
jgi:RNA polymerase sigma-70 factor (ECF subfamily)